MENNDIHIRVASEDDAEEILAIYAPYVIKTAITFEYEVPTLKEFRGRIRHTLQKYPYLVAEQNGKILGYAYVGPFHDRAAYEWAVENFHLCRGKSAPLWCGRKAEPRAGGCVRGYGNPEYGGMHRCAADRG